MDKSNRIQKYEYLRALPLETVLINDGAKQDIHDRKKWHTRQGPISITGPKFFNWQYNYGGGGAIDLVMHLRNCEFSTAVAYLNTSPSFIRKHEKKPPHYPGTQLLQTGKKLLLPGKNITLLSRVTSYLIKERKLPQNLIRQFIEAGWIYADDNANAVFIMRGKATTVVGAELRGAGHKKWRGLAPGSDRQKGAFYTGNSVYKSISLCESAIDALSYVTLYPNTLAISTAGANPNIRWIGNFIKKGFEVICDFDNDHTGNQIAEKLITMYPMLKRHRPKAHDWNDVLRQKMLEV